MKAEELVKEADLYNREGECFIHVEAAAGAPPAFIMSGDPGMLMTMIYPMICRVAQVREVSPRAVLKQYRKMFRRMGDMRENMVDCE